MSTVLFIECTTLVRLASLHEVSTKNSATPPMHLTVILREVALVSDLISSVLD